MSQCWQLVAALGELPEGAGRLKVGAIIRMDDEKLPTEAVWSAKTLDWVPLRWAKCDDPTAVTA